MRTREGISPLVSAGSAWFTLIGFAGIDVILAILFLFLTYREIERGPEPNHLVAGEIPSVSEGH
jgi:cytochrome d ubiquinol oxidase subunit I